LLGEIQFEEFVAVMSRKVQATYTADEVKSAFKVFEGTAPPGFIKVEALERALTVYGADRLTNIQVADLINQIDTDQNGLFNYVEVNKNTNININNIVEIGLIFIFW
jgi:calmodulin